GEEDARLGVPAGIAKGAIPAVHVKLRPVLGRAEPGLDPDLAFAQWLLRVFPQRRRPHGDGDELSWHRRPDDETLATLAEPAARSVGQSDRGLSELAGGEARHSRLPIARRGLAGPRRW